MVSTNEIYISMKVERVIFVAIAVIRKFPKNITKFFAFLRSGKLLKCAISSVADLKVHKSNDRLETKCYIYKKYTKEKRLK